MENIEEFRKANKMAGKFKVTAFLILLFCQLVVAAFYNFIIGPTIFIISTIVVMVLLIASKIYTEIRINKGI